jgi:hypothetical protein
MKIAEITIHAGRVIPHPFLSYSNLKPGISYRAVLDANDDPIEATKALQAQAESLLEDHCRHLVKSLEELQELTAKQQKVRTLQESIQRAQSELDRLREGLPALDAPAPPPAVDDDDEPDDDERPSRRFDRGRRHDEY